MPNDVGQLRVFDSVRRISISANMYKLLSLLGETSPPLLLLTSPPLFLFPSLPAFPFPVPSFPLTAPLPGATSLPPSYLTPSLSPSIFSIPPQPFPPYKDPLLKSISRGSWKRCQLPAGLGGARTTIPGVY